MEGQESTEAKDLHVLRILTLKGKAFHVFNLEKWNNQLRLIKGYETVASELLRVRAPDEINPLFTFKTVGIPHHFLASAHSPGSSRFRGGGAPENKF